MQVFSDFVASSIGIILISVVLESISPEGIYKKYIKFAFGLIITITIISSIYSLLSITYNPAESELFKSINFDSSNYRKEYDLQINDLFEENLKYEIEKNIKNKLNLDCTITAKVEGNFDNISLFVKCNKLSENTIKNHIKKTYSIDNITFEDGTGE
ncbi:MAG: hypothetical protein E7391_07745 [Ruminococcaceae bacterium]|nr:hypothetical protein [Oscillospiraceae bacterium]